MERAIYYNEISIPQAKSFLPKGVFSNNEIFVIDDINADNFPVNSKYVKCIVLIFCENGKLRYDIDGHTVIAEQGDMIILSMGQKVSNYKVLSSTFHAKAIFVSIDCIEHLAQNYYTPNTLRLHLLATDIIKFDNQEISKNSLFISLIKEYLTSPKYRQRLQLSIDLTKNILHKALDRNEYPREDEDLPKSNERLIFEQFIKLANENINNRNPISFYCKEINISRTYLEKIVNQQTGKTPSKLLHKSLLYQICILAERNTEKGKIPIKTIAKKTHFPSEASLSRFVKRELNMSLTQYRHLRPELQQNIIHHTIAVQNFESTAPSRIDRPEHSVPLPFG